MESTPSATARRKSCRGRSNREEASTGSVCCSPEKNSGAASSTPSCNPRASSSVHPYSSSSSTSDEYSTARSIPAGRNNRAYQSSHSHLCSLPSSNAFAAAESCSSKAEIPRSSGITSSYTGGNDARSCLELSSSCSSGASDTTGTALFAGGGRRAPRGRRRSASKADYSVPGALCSSRPATECSSEERACGWKTGEGGHTGGLLCAHRQRRGRGGSDDTNHQFSSPGEMIFSSALLLWLLAPFLYLNELTKFRLLSKSLNSRWLSLHRMRWLMCNSIALVFPAQWGVPRLESTHQQHCCSLPVSVPPQRSSGEKPLHGSQQQQQQQVDEEHGEKQEEHIEQQQERRQRQEEQGWQQKAELEKRGLQATLRQEGTEGREELRQQQAWQNEREAAAADAGRGVTRSEGDRQADALLALAGEATGAGKPADKSGRVAMGCSSKVPSLSNFLQAVLLRSPSSYGCAPLQLRQLTLHMPESPDAVLSLEQFTTYRSLLEVCSPTLEELSLIDFSSFYAVVDVSPALREALRGSASTGGAVAGSSSPAAAGGVSLAAERNLRRALAVVRSACHPPSLWRLEGEDDVVAAGEAIASPAAVAAAGQSRTNLPGSTATELAGNSGPATAPRGQQRRQPAFLKSPLHLRVCFKIWSSCRSALEEDVTDDYEREQAAKLEEEGNSESDTGKSPTRGTADGGRVPRFWSVNSYGDFIDPAAPAAVALSRASADRTEQTGKAARQFFIVVSRATRPARAERSLPTSSAAPPSTAEADGEERVTDSVGLEAAADDTSSLTGREATGGGGGSTVPPVAHCGSGGGGERDGHSAAAVGSSAAMHGRKDGESLSASAPAASATAAGHASEFCRGELPCGAPVLSDLSRIPAGADVYQLVHDTVRSLKLNCCFPQLKRLHVYGYSEWKTARPYLSCLACLFLPRASEAHWPMTETSRRDSERRGADTEGSRRSSRRSHSSSGGSDESRRSLVSETRSNTSSNSQRRRSRARCGHARLRKRSSNSSSRQSHSTSRGSRVSSASPGGRPQQSSASSTAEKRRRASTRCGCSVDAPRRRGRSPASRQKGRAVMSKGKNEEVGDAAAAGDAASSAIKRKSARIAPVAGGRVELEGEKAKGTGPEGTLAFPNLEEVWWLDASCVEEDMCAFLCASQTRRLKKLSFSTYSPSTVSLLLEKCVAHPRIFKNLRELVIDGMNLIWPEDEWWWFSGNSFTRFVEIWMLHAMNRYQLAPPYPVPRTLQQLEAERRQQEQQQRSRQQRADTCSACGTQPHPKQRRQPNGHRRRPRCCPWRGEDSRRQKGSVLSNSIQKLSTPCNEATEERVQESGVLCPGGRHDVARSDQICEGERERERRTAETDECVEEAASESAPCGWKTPVEDETRRLSESTRWRGSQERSSKSRRSDGRRGLMAKGAGLRRRRWNDESISSTDDEEKGEESESQEEEELPAGFVGGGAELDYEGIKKAMNRLPRVRKLRLLSFSGDILGGPDDSTHTLGSFFPEADLEIQGSLFIGRRLLQRFLMNIVHKAQAAKRRDREQNSGRVAGKNVLRWRSASTASGVSCTGGIDGVKQRRGERQRSLLSHIACASETEEKDSSDDSPAGPTLEFPAPPALSFSTGEGLVGSVTSRLVVEEPVASQAEVSPEWRRLTSEAVRLNPVGQQYVMRWLRSGLVYKVRMTLAIQWADRTELHVDAFHRECVSEYIRDVVGNLPDWMRKKNVNASRVNSLRILELTDSIQETNKPLEGYEDARGYFVPFGRVKDVLAYFTPFLLGLNCFSQFIPFPHGETDEDGSVCSPPQDSGTRREAGTESSKDEAEREDRGRGDEDVTDGEEAHPVDERIRPRSNLASWRTRDEQAKVKQRRSTIHLDHDLVRNVSVVRMQRNEKSTVLQPPNLNEEQSFKEGSETCPGGPPRVTVPGFPATGLESSTLLIHGDQHERGADSEILVSPERACTADPRSTDRQETPTVSPASDGARGTHRHTMATDDAWSPDGDLPNRSLRVLRLKGVVGLALPLYTRFIDYRKLNDVVRRVARAYRAQTRVLLVTDGTLLFYTHNKTHHDLALAALARDFKTVTKECMESLQVIDYRVYRPITWRCELGESQEQMCMPAFLRVFLRNNPEFRFVQRLDCIRPVDNEMEVDLRRVKASLTAYIWIRSR